MNTFVKVTTGLSEGDEQTCTSMFRNIMRVRHHLYALASEVAGKLGLRASEMATIDTLGKYGPLTMSELAKACFFSQPNATYTVSALEKSDLLKRERSADSHRIVNVHLSSAGEKVFKKSYPTTLKQVNAFFDARLTKAEQATLARLLDKLAD